MEGNKLNEKPMDEYPGVKSANSNRLDVGVMDPGTSLARLGVYKQDFETELDGDACKF